MKITIAYTAADEPDAKKAAACIKGLFPTIKIHRSDRKAPFLHLYMSTKNTKDPCEKPPDT